MPLNQSFSLEAKVEPEVSGDAEWQIIRDVEEALNDAETNDSLSYS